MSQPDEKRRHPRIAHRVAVRSQHHQAAELETVDLSAGGMCCTASRSVPPMTRMELTLILPPNGVDGRETGERLVRGEAVVVRSVPNRSDGNGYRIALFFSRMDPRDRETLVRFLKSRSR